MTMKIAQKLMLAAVTAVSLGAGAAQAQNLTPNYWPNQDTRTNVNRDAGQVQSGSSDLNTAGNGFHLGWLHATPDRGVATVGGDGG
jgi:hypothetical protein